MALTDWTADRPLTSVTLVAFLAWLTWIVQKVITNIYLHPLSTFPGPKLAACTTYWKAFVECVLNRSFCHELEALHKIYGKQRCLFARSLHLELLLILYTGDVVRIGPNEVSLAFGTAYELDASF